MLLITYTAKTFGQRQKQDKQDRKRQDMQDIFYLAYPAACDRAHPVLYFWLVDRKGDQRPKYHGKLTPFLKHREHRGNTEIKKRN